MGTRLKLLRQYFGLTQKEFAEKIGVSLPTVKRWESSNQKLDDRTVKLISELFNISENWLKTGEGEMIVKREPNAKLVEIEGLPVVARVGAGFPQSVEDFDILYYVPLPKYLSHKYKDCFAVEVNGDSMEPTLEEGDIVICNPVRDITLIPSGKIVVVANESGELLIKRLKRDRQGNIILISDNLTYEPIKPNSNKIVGQAFEVIKRVKV